MSDVEKTQVAPEEIRNAARVACDQLIKAVGRSGAKLQIPENVEDELILATLQHHKEHLKVHRIKQTHVDAYKLVSWLGCKILRYIRNGSQEPIGGQEFLVADALVKTLVSFLSADSGKKVVMPAATCQLLTGYLIEELKDNCNHGIWMNGLFVAFHCSVQSIRQMESAYSPS